MRGLVSGCRTWFVAVHHAQLDSCASEGLETLNSGTWSRDVGERREGVVTHFYTFARRCSGGSPDRDNVGVLKPLR
jgi:hypothetical protein